MFFDPFSSDFEHIKILVKIVKKNASKECSELLHSIRKAVKS